MRKMICLLVMLAFATPLFASDPFVGTWKLDPAKTKYTTGTAPKELTAVIELQGSDLQVTATGTNGDGSPISVKYIIPVAGGAGTVQAGDFDAITTKVISNTVRLNTYTKNGKELRTRRMVLSPDGKTMKTTVQGTSAANQQVQGVDVFYKQ